MKNTFKLFIACCGLTVCINSDINASDYGNIKAC